MFNVQILESDVRLMQGTWSHDGALHVSEQPKARKDG